MAKVKTSNNQKTKQVINIKNKRASFEYLLLEKFTAGIILTGS